MILKIWRRLVVMKVFLLVGVFFLVGCVPTSTVEDVGDNQSINPITMSCKKPYVFTQDCSAWSGANRKINIDGFDVVVAGSADGSIILVMDAHFYKNILIDNPFILSSQNHSEASNNSYYTVKKILKQHGINIQKVRPLELWGDISGYVMELDADGYTTLIKYTIK